MKKIITVIACALLLTNFGVVANASESKVQEKIERKVLVEKLDPYQKIINKINKEYGASITIPTDELSEVYNNISDTSLEEFESNLRKDYEEVKNLPSNVYIDLTNEKANANTTIEDNGVDAPSTLLKNNEETTPKSSGTIKESDSSLIITPFSMRESITQYTYLDYGRVFLSSVVFSGSGSPGTFTYQSITGSGHSTYTDRTHFRSTTSSHSLSNGNKNCTVVYKGSLYTAAGINLLTTRTYTITYSAS